MEIDIEKLLTYIMRKSEFESALASPDPGCTLDASALLVHLVQEHGVSEDLVMKLDAAEVERRVKERHG